MPLTISNTAYAGEVIAVFLTKAVAKNLSVRKGILAVEAGIKKQKEVPTIDVNDMIQPRVEEPDRTKHSGSVAVDARFLRPQDMMFLVDFNPAKFENHWFNTQLGKYLLDEELPMIAENAITQYLMEKGGEQLDSHIWQSVYQPTVIATVKSSGWTGITDRKIFFNGFLPRFLADSNVIKVPTPVAFSKANIFDKFEAVKSLVPVAIKENPNLKYLCNEKTIELYELAQQGQNYKGANVTDAGKRTFGGKEIVVISGIPDDTIIAGVFTDDLESNIWLGVNEVDEQDYIKLDKWTNAGENWFMKSLFKMDVNYAFPAQIVVYTTWELPNGVSYTAY
jgi:hypothetical protein